MTRSNYNNKPEKSNKFRRVHLFDREQTVDWDSEVLLKRTYEQIRNVRLAIEENSSGFKILGPSMKYLTLDDNLPEEIKKFGLDFSFDEILAFHQRRPLFDLTLEDSWTGYFIAKQLQRKKNVKNLVLFHIDDHNDMMPALFYEQNGQLRNAALGTSFNPKSPADWKTAILTGAVGIGNIITPFYWAFEKVHVLHLNNRIDSDPMIWNIVRTDRSIPFCKDLSIISLRRKDWDWANSCGTYQASNDPRKLLSEIPDGVIIGHIDLDYFINSFDGGNRFLSDNESLNELEKAKMKARVLFEAVKESSIPIQRWIVGISPGFCPSEHWRWLLNLLQDNIFKPRS